MITRLDAEIFGRVERFSHWSQRLTGLTNFWWARAMLMGMMVGLAELALLLSSQYWPFMAAVLSLKSLDAFMLWRYYAAAETHYLDGADTAHPYTLSWREQIWSRLISIVVVVWRWGALPWASGQWGLSLCFAFLAASWIAQLYFHCVIPLPPGTSKIKEWKDKLMASFQGIPQSVPAASS